MVMTDGRDAGSKLSLAGLRQRLQAARGESSGDAPVKVFTIAYGDEADPKVLADIAEAAGGWSGKGDVSNIKDLYAEAASFF
jgi:Ca-activated chloride channel family protein